MFGSDGMLSWEHVKREYVMKCIDSENDVKSTKHTLKKMSRAGLHRGGLSPKAEANFLLCLATVSGGTEKESISEGWIVSLWESLLGHFCFEKIMHCFQRSSTDQRLTDSVQHYLEPRYGRGLNLLRTEYELPSRQWWCTSIVELNLLAKAHFQAHSANVTICWLGKSFWFCIPTMTSLSADSRT